MARLLSTRVWAGRIAAAKTISADNLSGRTRLSLLPLYHAAHSLCPSTAANSAAVANRCSGVFAIAR